MNGKDIDVFPFSTEDLKKPEEIDIHGLLLYKESGHNIVGSSKKIDKLIGGPHVWSQRL